MIIKSLPIGFLLLTIFVSTGRGKEWRGIVPLKSTRADVERLFGKPNQLGRYEIENERVSIFYAERPCNNSYNLAQTNCYCLVAKDTVFRISVTLDRAVKVARLGIDKKNYERTLVNAAEPTATYADFTEGIVYTISESEDAVTHIVYLPSAKDCEAIVKNQQETATLANGWQGIVPFRATRSEVERLLGKPKSSLSNIYTYETPENRVDVYYSSDPCQTSGTVATATPTEIVERLSVTPRKTVLIKELRLDKTKYIRIQHNHPENFVEYRNATDAITVEALLDDGCEQVITIIYKPTQGDRQFRCGRNN